MLLAFAAISALSPFNFYVDEPYDRAIPRPDALLGYGIGERTTNFRDQERALMAIANAAGARVRTIEFGKSCEGRPLRLYVVSNPKNMSRLEDIRKDNAQRAEGKSVGASEPTLVWVNECIHGDETASFESGMALLYNLAASRSPRIERMLDRTVVLINPCYNPDGHERYTVYYNSIATGSPEPGSFEMQEPATVFGRLNHYRFDMNRDRVAMSQPETRQEVAEFLRWHPQVYIDQHGQVETYFFPPNAMSQNVNVDRDRVNKWTDIFGRATGKAFDAHGWTYFVKDTFDLYYPGYLDSFTTLSGAIGMTHETDGGRVLASRRSDDTILTLRDGVMKHFTSALAVIDAAAEHHDDLLASFVAYKKRAASGEFAGKFRRVVLQGDAREIQRLKEKLASTGIDSTVRELGFSANDAHDYWTGTAGPIHVSGPLLIVDMAQPQGPLAKALLEPGSDFEPEFLKAQIDKKKTAPAGETYPGPEGAEFYDTTAWSLPYAHNLHAWWCESAPTLGIEMGSDARDQRLIKGGVSGSSTVGYFMPYADQEDVLAAMDALRAGLKCGVNAKDIAVGTERIGHGTFMFLAARNEESYESTLRQVAQRRHVAILPIPTSYPESGRQGPGSEGVIHLRVPKIGIVFGQGANMAQVGGIWFLMEQVWHLPFTALSTGALNGDISKYTTIVVPPGSGITLNQKLRDWVSGGGCLVGLGGLQWALGAGNLVELQSAGEQVQDLPGSIFRAQLDQRSFLSFGYDSKEIAVPVEGSSFYKVRKEGGSVVKFDPDDKVKKLLSGWEWPEETEKALAGTVWLQDVPVGRGHAILFTYDPTSRAMWPGLYKLLLNAMLIGPSA